MRRFGEFHGTGTASARLCPGRDSGTTTAHRHLGPARARWPAGRHGTELLQRPSPVFTHRGALITPRGPALCSNPAGLRARPEPQLHLPAARAAPANGDSAGTAGLAHSGTAQRGRSRPRLHPDARQTRRFTLGAPKHAPNCSFTPGAARSSARSSLPARSETAEHRPTLRRLLKNPKKR